ncbi:MCE family protein [Salinifilum ghardaiensis]
MSAHPRTGTRTSAGGGHRLRVIGALLLAVTVFGGCGFRGVYDMPLPGGADVGSDPYQVRIHFRDVLDLVPNSGVRVNNVPVGRVSDIRLTGESWLAEVTVQLNGDVELPANAVARLRQSSLLGEKYVDLSAPAKPEAPRGELRDGALVPVERTNRSPEVEEVLGALSMLLNGGGVAQLQSITSELNTALDGRESDARELLHNIDELVTRLDAQRDDITRALDSVNRLSAKLNAQRQSIDKALTEIEPGLRVLNQQREDLVTMLRSLDELSGVATDVVERGGDDVVHNLNQLAPTVRKLAEAGSALPKSFEVLATFPFPDNAVEGIKGSDYVNLYADVDLNLTRIIGNLGRSQQPLLRAPDLPLPLGQEPGDPPVGQPERDDGRQTPTQPVPTPSEQPQPSEQPDDGGGDGGGGDGLLGGLFGGN